MRLIALLATLLFCACGNSALPADPESFVMLSWASVGEYSFLIRRDEQVLGELRPDGSGGLRLRGPAVMAELKAQERALNTAHAYPRRVRIDGRMSGSEVGFRTEYTLLAPAAPLPVEGYGLVVSGDAAGTNDREHAALRDWLATQGLPADTRPFQRLHEQETGRELRAWYEISGRRIRGRFDRQGRDEPIARMDSLFRSEAGELKIHHKRTGENGRLDYHRQSLELANTLTPDGDDALVTHECGCYGYAIAGDFMTLGPALYHIEADWLDDRVGADFFIGLERRPTFPWIGFGDRLRIRNLARRAGAYLLTDAAGERFAEIALELPDDPPASELGRITYRVARWDADGKRQLLARIEHDGSGIRLALFGPDEMTNERIEQLDALLAAMPVQVMRGDGVRDSHLLEIEQLIDAIRLLRQPGEDRLADLVSDVDAATAVGKVRTMLEREARHLVAEAETLPPAPIQGPGRTGQDRTTR
ncbi:MAG: hypothetical protein GY723_05800 [bacterium]|nr:hypothetical protein [bacterium]MCP5065060.1 hypothetical protein [bacterium]